MPCLLLNPNNFDIFPQCSSVAVYISSYMIFPQCSWVFCCVEVAAGSLVPQKEKKIVLGCVKVAAGSLGPKLAWSQLEPN